VVSGKRTGGGSATAAGSIFQSAASAWYCVGILAEQDFPPPLDLAATTTLKFIRCETEEPVDDILVMTSDDGLIFAQAKHKLSLETGSTSELASAVDQCVRQYLANRSTSQPKRPWNRPLVASTDRLVIIVGKESSGPIKHDLPVALESVRALAGRPLDDAAQNEEQKRALKVIKEHCSVAWRAATASLPSDSDLVGFLQLLRIQVLDLDDDGAEQRNARALLRTAILRDAASDNKTWGMLGRYCEELAAHRRGADRQVLQRHLLKEGVDVEAPRSYRADIDKLNAHSKTSLALLRDLALLRTGHEFFSIERRCTSAFVDAALKGSLLITGEPGSGKSGLLYWLADRCRNDGVDCVVILVDRIAASSPGELQRDLGLEHEVHDVLQNWPSSRLGVLLIDALDAAREDRASRTIRDLIRLSLGVGGRWNVVATIRKFDLRYSAELRELFRGAPPASPRYADLEFKLVRHLNVPVLDDDELLEIGQKAPTLGRLLTEASSTLRELLRNAFNIRLAADLLNSEFTFGEFTEIRSQLQLLESYWQHRVLGPGSDAREQLLRAASEAMVRHRSLRVDRQNVAANGGESLETLLSRNVLVEWQTSEGTPPNRHILSYSHHVLHDYAIACLLLRGDREILATRLSQDADFALVARPSISMHFHYLWDADPKEFWQLSFDVLALNDAPKILQLVGPSVAAESFDATDELEPLRVKLTSTSPEVTPQFFTHFVGAVVTLGVPLVGTNARPWWPFLLRLSESLNRQIAFPMQSLLGLAIDRSQDATPEQLVSLGRIAHAFLRFAWSHTEDVSSMVWVGVQGVCRALSVYPAGRDDIQRIIEPERIRALGYLELPWVAHEITHIIDADPDLALDVYRAAFAHEEPSEETTQLSKSRILPLTSNKRQDYGMALWSLGEKYEHFLETAPSQATIALTAILGSYIRRRHRYAERTQLTQQTFEFRGKTIELHDDGSGIWDSGGVYSRDDGIKVLDAFEEYVLLCSQQKNRARLEATLDLLAGNESSAIVWRRLLLIAVRDGGEELTPLVAPMLLSSKFLLAPDVTFAVGEFLRVRATALDEDLRGRIEDVLLSTPDVAEDREYAEYKRAKLVGCLPLDAIVRAPMRELSSTLRAQGNVPVNEDASFSTWAERDTEGSYIREQLGVEPDAPAVKSLMTLYAPLSDFSSKFLNEDPSEADAQQIFPSIVALHDTLGTLRDVENTKLVNHAWGYLAAACAAVAHASGFHCGTLLGSRVTAILLEAASNEEPIFNERADAGFEQHPGWGSPAARIDAAKGLTLLGQHKACISDDLRNILRRLVSDAVAPVRYQIAARALAFYTTDKPFFWELIQHFAHKENNRGVLGGVVHTVGRIVGRELDEAITLLLLIRDRAVPGPADRSEVRRSIDSIVAQAYVYRDHNPSERHIRSLMARMGENASALDATLHHLRDTLTYHDDDKTETEVRARGFSLFLELLRGAHDAIGELEAKHSDPFDMWPTTDQQTAKDLHELVRGISDQVYFASGAFDEGKPEESATSKESSSRFYKEAEKLLDELTNVKIAAASQHLIATLAFFAAEDPRGIFLRVAKSVRSAQFGGYQHESLGAREIVTLVERYIAEYRTVFREEALRRALMEMLDTFVAAGWPSARKLVYRLDEIFR
jgi:hypothetical protein